MKCYVWLESGAFLWNSALREWAVRTNKSSIALDGKHVVIISSIQLFAERLGVDFGSKLNERIQFCNS